MVAVHAAEEEAEEDLAHAVAGRLVHRLDGVEAGAGHELRDEHLLAREGRHDVGHDDERVPAEDARQRALVLGLELVVELLADPVADLLGRRLDVDPRRDLLHQPQDHAEVLHVGADGLGDAGVLHLDRHVAAVEQRRAVDLADRRRGDRLLVEGGEDLSERRLQLALDHLAHVGEADVRRGVAQLAQLALELVAVLLRHQPDVEEGEHLAQLHGRALHGPQRGDDLLRGLEVAALERGLAAALVAREVRRLGAEPARPLADGEPRDARRAGDPRRRDAVLGHGPEGCQGAGVAVSAGGAAAGDGAAGATLGVGVGVGVAPGAGVALGVGVPLGVGVALLSGVGVAFSLSLSFRSLFRCRRRWWCARRGGDGVAGGQLDERDDGGRGDEGEQAGDDGQPPLLAREPPAARLVVGARCGDLAIERLEVLPRRRRQRVELRAVAATCAFFAVGLRRGVTALTASTGRSSSADTTATTTGVKAAATTVPDCQIMGTMKAAAALDAPAISRVFGETPCAAGRSEATATHASEDQPVWTCDPGTMSCEPSGQRTHALWPPS